MRTSTFVAAMLLLVWATAAAPACAQATFQPNWAGWGSANLGMNALAHQGNELHGRGAAPQVPHPSAAAPTTYQRDPAVTRRVEAAFVDYVEKVGGPQEAATVRDDLAHHDFVDAWRSTAGTNGLRPGDLADAMAAYWILNWAMANTHDAGPAEAAGVKAQLRRNLATNPTFQRLTEAQRQETAETFMLNYVYQQNIYAAAAKRDDQPLLHKLSDAAEARFSNEMHLDLRGLRLTDAGFAGQG